MKMVNSTDISATANVERGAGEFNGIEFSTVYKVECFGPDGKLKWEDGFVNTVVNVGLDNVLNEYFKGSAYTAAWYVGLITGPGATVIAGDTMASSGFTENANYTGTRPALTLGTVVSQSVSNTASKASFAIDTDSQTIGGCFINTAASGTAGVLYGGGAFTGGDKAVDDGDTLNVTVTLTAASA